MQAYDSIMCWYFCIGIIDFMLKGKSLLAYKNVCSPNNYGENETIILKYFQWLKRWKNYIVFCCKYRKLEKTKISYLLENSYFCYLQ